MEGSSGLIHVGTVGRPHGVRGEVKIIPETDEPERLVDLGELFLGSSDAEAQPFPVERIRFQHSKKGLTLLVKFAGFETPEQAQVLRRWSVMVRRSDFPLEEDETLAADLIGFEVVSTDGERLGQIRNVLDLPAQIVYEVERMDGQIAMVPGVEAFVREVDVSARRMTIAPIEGLFE